MDGLLVPLAYEILFKESVLSRSKSCFVGTANLASGGREVRFGDIWKPLNEKWQNMFEQNLLYFGMASVLSERALSRSARRLRIITFASATFSKRVSRKPRTLARARTSGIRLLIFGTSLARAIPRISPSNKRALSRSASSDLQIRQMERVDEKYLSSL